MFTMIGRVCEVCNAPFQVRPQYRTRRYCSEPCHLIIERGDQRLRRADKKHDVCIICSKPLTRLQMRTCSVACSSLVQNMGRSTRTIPCDHCGRLFTRTTTELRRSQNGFYCSKICAGFASAVPIVLPTISEDFGHWLAGLTDGEGSFNINIRTKPSKAIVFTFALFLRDDDIAVIEEVCRVLGTRPATRKPATDSGRPNSKPSAGLLLSGAAQCRIADAIFRKFPLRSKKRRDFETWSTALHEFLRGTQRDDTLIAALRDQLVSTRRYPVV